MHICTGWIDFPYISVGSTFFLVCLGLASIIAAYKVKR